MASKQECQYPAVAELRFRPRFTQTNVAGLENCATRLISLTELYPLCKEETMGLLALDEDLCFMLYRLRSMLGIILMIANKWLNESTEVARNTECQHGKSSFTH